VGDFVKFRFPFHSYGRKGMNKQRSAILGVALAMLGVVACEDKTEVVVPPPPPPPLQIVVTPASIELNVGQNQQIVAQVTGGDSAQVKTVTWASSNTAVATIAANGNVVTVTGAAAGVATITATATADANVRAAASVTVNAAGGVPPTISIKSITAGATNLPVNEQNVFGQIEITLNLDVPVGTRVNQVKLLANNVEFYSQTFSSPELAASADEAQSAVDLVASWNTAEFDRTLPATVGTRQGKYRNGAVTITAQVIGPQGTITAQTSRQIVLNNVPLVYVRRSTPSGTGCTLSTVNSTLGPPAGSQWCTGDVTFDAVGVSYSGNTNDDVSSLTLNGAANTTRTVTDAAAPFQLVLQKAASPSGSSIAGWEFPGAAFNIQGLTTGGQPLSGCVVVDATPTPLNLGCAVLGGTILLPNPLNIDNVAPAITVFDLTPDSLPGLACNPNFPVVTTPNACYVSDGFSFNTTQTVYNGPFFAMNDVGVGSPTVTFRGGTSSTTLVPVTTGASLPESVTANTYIAEATAVDKLANQRVVFASPAGGGQTSATGAQQFGVDTMAPVTTVGGPTNNSTNPVAAPNAWSLAPVDAGVGPSGFLPLFARVQLERFLPGTAPTTPAVTCFSPDDVYAGVTAACTLSSGAPNIITDNGVIGVPTGVVAPPAAGVEGYWRLTAFVVDAAWPGNSSGTTTQLLLNDVTPPVIGGISSPSSLPGGAPATFTAPLGDNVDLGRIIPSIDYGAGPLTIQSASVTLGTYGVPELVGSSTGTWTIPAFMRATEGTTGAGRSDGVVAEAMTVRFDVRDVANNNTTATLAINTAVRFPLTPSGSAVPTLATVDAATFAPVNALHGNFLHLAPSNATVCDGTATACGSSPPPSTVLSATMTGPNSTFANPFVRVEFYWQDPSNGRWNLIGNGTPAATDNTVTSTRTWTYTVTWTVTGILLSNGAALNTGSPINLVAVGVHSSGSAVVSTGTAQSVIVTAT
jgi:hypothetical protein